MRNILAAVSALLMLSACASVQKLDAANDVHALLTSIRDNDEVAFDAHVDRPSLEREIESRLSHEARKEKSSLGALGMLLAPTLAQLAGDALIQPQVFRAVADSYGYDPAKPLPGRLAISTLIMPLDDGRVCVTKKKHGPCVLIFTQIDGTWKLSGFEGDLKQLKIKG
jgi:hypothetical protein